jgi:phosphate transport system protein
MQRHFDDELAKLKNKLFKMGVLVEEAIRKSIMALEKRDTVLAKSIIEADQRINILEMEIDELGHELMALMQPTASDLRLITMVLRINRDLERMGDQAVNIAEKSMDLAKETPIDFVHDIEEMGEKAINMVHESLNAFVDKDVVKAKALCEKDDDIDNMNDRLYEQLQERMKKDPKCISQAVGCIMIAHNIERIGDLATNIAEDVIYLAKGIDIRHHITERRDS